VIRRLRARFAYPHDVWWYAITGGVIAEEFFRSVGRLPAKLKLAYRSRT